MFRLLEQFDHHDSELIQYYELMFLMEFLITVNYYQYVMENQTQKQLYHLHLNCLDVKYNVFHHLYSVIKQFEHYDLDRIQLKQQLLVLNMFIALKID